MHLFLATEATAKKSSYMSCCCQTQASDLMKLVRTFTSSLGGPCDLHIIRCLSSDIGLTCCGVQGRRLGSLEFTQSKWI